jgi:hypothetical protein
MAKFVLEIELGNEGMRTAHQIREKLREISGNIRSDDALEDLTQNIRDANGNVVGHYGVVE